MDRPTARSWDGADRADDDDDDSLTNRSTLHNDLSVPFLGEDNDALLSEESAHGDSSAGMHGYSSGASQSNGRFANRLVHTPNGLTLTPFTRSPVGAGMSTLDRKSLWFGIGSDGSEMGLFKMVMRRNTR